MRTVVAYPGNMDHAQNVAVALAERGALEAFVTTFSVRRDGALASCLARIPSRAVKNFGQELTRRSVEHVPPCLVHQHPTWEIVRSAAMKAGAGPVVTDILWDRMSCSFDALIARRYVPRASVVSAFEYTALAAFRRAKQSGVARILNLPSLDSKLFEEIQRREKSEWPELVSEYDAYFDRKFEKRYVRRCQEIALADVIITNSSLTARSHIRAGADPSKVFAVPLAAPLPIAEVADDWERQGHALKVIWAGTFGLRKGAHYLLEAWRLLNAKSAAELEVYGQVMLPERCLALQTHGICFHGSVPMSQLFKAFEAADVLVFPTLSDGFGMVVAEAMAHGLPVITTDQAGAADLVTPDNGLVVPAADPKALANALRWCLDSRRRLYEMRFNALETARRRQWADFRQDLIDALDRGLRQAGYNPEFNHPW
jgi:glycosyltransferase involved in cell wall biosynthesis